jgi:hypothetical protein
LTLFIHGKVTGHVYATVKGASVDKCSDEAYRLGYHPSDFAFEFDTGGVIPEEPIPAGTCEDCGYELMVGQRYCPACSNRGND